MPEITRWQKAKCRKITNRYLGNMAVSEPNSPITASPGYTRKTGFGFKIICHVAARGTQKGHK